MAPAAANRRQPDEAALWSDHLAVLRQALVLRHPDARGRVRSEAARLEREIAALNARRDLARRRQRWAEPGGAASAPDMLDAQIARCLHRLSDLAALLHDNAPPAAAAARGATPEAALRPSLQDPVTMLLGKGRLSEDQVRAAREIAWVHEAITKAGRARISRLSQIAPPAGWQEMPLPERAALVHAKRFLPWAERLRRDAPVTLECVLQVVVLGLSVYAVARRHRMGWTACVARLAEGLDRYWETGRDQRRRASGIRP